MDSSDMRTLPLSLPTSPGATTVNLSRRPAEPRGGVWRELSGALSVGLGALAVVVLVLQLLAWARDVPGPGAFMVLGHLIAAAAAIGVQRFADHRPGWPAAAAVLGVAVLAIGAVWLFWWA